MALSRTLAQHEPRPWKKFLELQNFESLKVFTPEVATSIEALFLDLVGEPFSATFIGDCGRLAGDRSREDDIAALESVGLGGGSGSLTGERSRQSPGFDAFGDVFTVPLNGDDRGLRAGLAMTDPLISWTALFKELEFEKSSFFEVFEAKTLVGGLTGLMASGFVGVLPVPASSSSEKSSFPDDNCEVFLGLRGDFCAAPLGWLRVARAAGTAGFRSGFALRPVAASFCFPFSFVGMGMMFSLPGSSN